MGALGDHGGVAEAQVHVHRARRALDGAGQGLGAVPARDLRAGLQPRLVDLDDVGAGREQIGDLRADDVGVGQRQRAVFGVVVVLGLLGHGERPGHRDLDGAVGVRPQEPDVVHLDRGAAPQLAHHPRHGDVDARAVPHRAGVLEVEPVQRGREVVGVGLAPDLPVGDDVEPRLLLGPDGGQRRVVLRLLEERLRHPPQLRGPHPGRELVAEPVAVDEPVGLGQAADDHRGQRGQLGRHRVLLSGGFAERFAGVVRPLRVLQHPQSRYNARNAAGYRRRRASTGMVRTPVVFSS